MLLNRFDMILCTADYLPMSDQTLDTTNNGLNDLLGAIQAPVDA